MAIRTVKKKSTENSLNTIQNIYEGNAGFNTSLSQVIDRMGIEQRPIQQGRCYTFDGVDDAIFRNMTGVTIISYSGTAILSIPGTFDRINATAGTAWDIRLSDGSFYKCDEGGGILAIDSSGNALDGQLINITPATFHTLRTDGFGADWQNQVGSTPNIRFNGTTGTSGISLGNSVNAQFTQNTTFTVHCRFVASSLNTSMLLSNYNGGGAGQFQIYITTNGAVRIVENVSQLYQSADNIIFTNTEYHLAVVRQGTGVNQTSVYLNGTLLSNFTWSNITTTTEILRVGQSNQGVASFGWNGWIRNICVSSQAIWNSNFIAPVTWTDYQTLENNFVHKWIIYNTQTVFNPFNLTITISNDTHSHFVPRNENNITLDAYGEPLFYKNRVKYNTELRQSNCIAFDGTDDFVEFPQVALGSGNWSVEGWFMFSNINTTNQTIFIIQNGPQIIAFLKESNLAGGGFANQLYFISSGNGGLYTGIVPVVNQWYSYRLQRVGTVVTGHINGIEVTRQTGDSTNYTISTINRIGRYSGASFPFSGRQVTYKITVAGTIVQDYTLQEGAGDRVFSRVGGHIGIMTNFSFPAAWTNRQDVVHNNLINGYEEYTDGGSGLIRVPLSSTGTSLGVIIAGFTSQGIRQSGTWHNDAETLTRQYQAPELIRNDNANTMFTLGVPNNMTWNTGLINSGNFIKTDLSQASQKRKARFRVKKIN